MVSAMTSEAERREGQYPTTTMRWPERRRHLVSQEETSSALNGTKKAEITLGHSLNQSTFPLHRFSDGEWEKDALPSCQKYLLEKELGGSSRFDVVTYGTVRTEAPCTLKEKRRGQKKAPFTGR